MAASAIPRLGGGKVRRGEKERRCRSQNSAETGGRPPDDILKSIQAKNNANATPLRRVTPQLLRRRVTGSSGRRGRKSKTWGGSFKTRIFSRKPSCKNRSEGPRQKGTRNGKKSGGEGKAKKWGEHLIHHRESATETIGNRLTGKLPTKSNPETHDWNRIFREMSGVKPATGARRSRRKQHLKVVQKKEGQWDWSVSLTAPRPDINE